MDCALDALKIVLATKSTQQMQIPPQISGLYQQSRAGFPLGFGHASSYVGKGVALIGYAYD